MTIPLPALPDLIERDPDVILQQTMDQLQSALGRTLQPGQVETIIAQAWAYLETLARLAYQDAAQQCFVAFARGANLDFLGQNIGVTRLPAAASETTLTFTLTAIQSADVVVPLGTRVQSADGKVIFATTANLTIPAGAPNANIAAAASVAGAVGNGYAAGTVTAILDPVSLVASATNTTTSSGGADVETDDAFRARVQQAPNQFSVAGSVDSYVFHAKSVSETITDVTVSSPVPGAVRLYVLTNTGLPSPTLLADVLAALSDQKVRPLTDAVEVVAPTEIGYAINVTVQLLTNADPTTTLAAVQAAATSYAADRAAGIGRDIVPSQLMAALSVPGVYQVTLTSPALIVVDDTQWAKCTAVTVTNGASEEG